MIDYDTYCRIKRLADRDKLSITEIAQELGLNWRTVERWASTDRFIQRAESLRASKLDPFKASVQRLLEKHPYSAVQILRFIREEGYEGKITILKDYLSKVRPPSHPAYLTLSFAPGEAAQIDWGEYGAVPVGETRRRLSFFVMVLCYSRMMYLEFSLRQTMEQLHSKTSVTLLCLHLSPSALLLHIKKRAAP